MYFLAYCCKCLARESSPLFLFYSFGAKYPPLFFPSLTIMSRTVKRAQSSKAHTKCVNTQYEKSIKALNSLQTNAQFLEQRRKEKLGQIPYVDNANSTQVYLERAGITLSKLDHLQVIHVAGTKGKGSTCAFVESILREHGYKTGLFSSPHLVSVTERIRINGIPISKNVFSSYFWDVYNALQKANPTDLPQYFKFLTVLAFKIFSKEEVDVAVIEVGIGGEYDSTNVLRHPIVCGITTLDLDHTAILGDKIESIAWNKSGIMKPCAPTFTVEQELPGAFPVLLNRAQEKKIPLYVVPLLEDYDWGGQAIHLALSASVQRTNASLALQLAHYFMQKTKSVSNEESLEEGSEELCGKPFPLSEEDIFALQNVNWPGRSQVLVKDNVTFFLDGAHTPLSIRQCVKWYTKVSMQHAPSDEDAFKVLIFNVKGERDYVALLSELLPCRFDLAIFTTNLSAAEKNASADQTNYNVSDASQVSRCEKLRQVWLALTGDEEARTENVVNGVKIKRTSYSRSCLTFFCIQDVLLWLSCGQTCLTGGKVSIAPEFPPPERLKKASHVQVLITGSMHLVGGFLGFLDPSLSQDGDDITATCVADLVKMKYSNPKSDATGAR